MLGGLATRFVAHLLQLSMSRCAEFDADSVAADLCGSKAMISALEKIQDASNARAFHGKDDEETLASFRGGAFAHSYISRACRPSFRRIRPRRAASRRSKPRPSQARSPWTVLCCSLCASAAV